MKNYSSKSIKSALRVSTILLLSGLIWIIFSDRYLDAFVFSLNELSFYQSLKGILFVVVISIIIFAVILSHDKKLRTILNNYRDIFNFNSDPIIIMGYLDYEIIEMNKKFKEVFEVDSFNDLNPPIVNFIIDTPSYNLDSFKKNFSKLKELKNVKFRWVFQSSHNKKIEATVTAKLSRYKNRDVIFLLIKDVSEIIEIKKELNDTSFLLEKAFNSCDFGLFITIKEGKEYRINYVNDHLRNIFNISQTEQISLNRFKLFNSDYKEFKIRNFPFIEVLEGKEEGRNENIYIKFDDKDNINVQFKSFPIKNDSGEILSVVSILEDTSIINSLKTENEELEQKYRSFIETSHDAIVIFDAEENKIVDYNKKALYLFKVTADELVKLHPSDLSPKNQPAGETSLEMSNRYINAALKGGTPKFEWMHKNKYGNTIPCEVSLAKLPSKGKKLLRCTVVDVSERSLAEDMLNKTENICNAVFSSTSDLITIHYVSNGELINANQTFQQNFDYDLEYLKGKNIKDIYCSDGVYNEKEFDKKIKKAILDKKSEFKWKSRTRDGKDIWLEVLLKYVDTENDKIFIVVAQNINEVLLAESEMIQLSNSLEEKNNEFRKILFTTTHDLRTPLLNILGFSNELKHNYLDFLDYIEKEKEIDCNEVKNMIKDEWGSDLGIILDNTKKMSVLINGLLEVSKIETYETKKEWISTNLLMREIKKNLEHKLEEFDVKFLVEDLPDCYSDKYKLQQVFTNLIENSISYRNEKEKSFVKISGKVEESVVRYIVEDNGIGVEDDNLDKILEMFYRNDPEMADGSGLGLTIVTKALAEINGNLTYYSERFKGSTFQFTIPKIDQN